MVICKPENGESTRVAIASTSHPSDSSRRRATSNGCVNMKQDKNSIVASDSSKDAFKWSYAIAPADPLPMATMCAGHVEYKSTPASVQNGNKVFMTNTQAKSFELMPPASGYCPVCASEHDPTSPHNPQSLYWQTKRGLEGLPMPTWEDALEHVTGELREAWESQLKEVYGFGCPECGGWKRDREDYLCAECRTKGTQ